MVRATYYAMNVWDFYEIYARLWCPFIAIMTHPLVKGNCSLEEVRDFNKLLLSWSYGSQAYVCYGYAYVYAFCGTRLSTE